MVTKFCLRKTAKNYAIYFEFRDGVKTRLRLATGFFIRNKNDWDTKNEKIKIPSSTSNAKDINIKLADVLLNFTKELYLNYSTGFGEYEASILFNKLIGNTKEPEVEKKTIDLIAYYKWFRVYYAENNSPYSKKVLKPGTIRTFNSAFNLIESYMDERKIKALYFNTIDREFYYDFLRYLTDKKFSKNYIGTVIQKLKTVMGYAFDENKHTNLEFKKNYFSKISEPIAHPYLNSNELKSIEKLSLSDSKMDIARDIFLIGCYTGLRIGDLLNFIKNPDVISDGGYMFFKVSQQKTSNPVIIPLNKIISQILNKYDGNLPPYMRENEINIFIKSICKRAKIDQQHCIKRTEGGLVTESIMPKYKFVTTHTARRSFCTNAYKSGMPVHDIMAISGHKSERVFLNYVKVHLEENAKRIAQHTFFN